MSDEPGLTELERELLELISMTGEPTTVLDEEMLERSPGRSGVEAVLRGLLGRGLLVTERAINAGVPRRSDGQSVYEDDWWVLTRAGRAALSEEPRVHDRT